MFSAASKTNKVASSGSSTPTDPYIAHVAALVQIPDTAPNGQNNRLPVDSGGYNVTPTLAGNATMGSFGPYGKTWSVWIPTGQTMAASITTNGTMTDVGTGDFTIEGWINCTSTTLATACELIDGGPAIGLNATGQVIYYDGSGGVILSTSTTLLAGVWYHIAVSRSSGTSKVFVNGTQVASGADSKNYTGMSLTIGDGVAAGLFVSNCRYSEGSLYNSSFTPSTTPLTAVSGTKWMCCNSAQFFLNGGHTTGLYTTLSASVICTPFSPFGEAYNAETHGASVHLDGSGDVVSVPALSLNAFGSNDFTLECWWYGYGSATGGVFTQRTDGTTYSPIEVYVNTSNRLTLLASTNGSTWGINVSSASYPLILNRYTWNHIVVTRSGSAFKVFCNGYLFISTTFASSLVNNGVTQTWGARGADISTPMSGYLSDCRLVMNSNLYPTSSTTVGTKIFTPPTAPLSVIPDNGSIYTAYLYNFKNAGVYDQRKVRNFELIGNCYISSFEPKFGTTSLNMDNSGGTLSYARTLANQPYVINTNQDFTFECWVNVGQAASGGNKVIFFQGTLGIAFTDTTVKVFTGSAYTSRASATYTMPLNTWTHIAASRTNGTISIFINGTLTGTPTVYSSGATSTTGIFIGSYSTPDINTCFTGRIEELRFTNGVGRYTSSFTVPTAPYPNQ